MQQEILNFQHDFPVKAEQIRLKLARAMAAAVQFPFRRRGDVIQRWVVRFPDQRNIIRLVR